MDKKPDFTKYSYQELLEAKEGINRAKYPDRYEEVIELLSRYSVPEEKPKKKRIRSKLELIISTGFMVIFTIYCLVQQKIPGRYGGFNPEEDYYMYWGFIVSFVVIVIYNINYYWTKYNA